VLCTVDRRHGKRRRTREDEPNSSLQYPQHSRNVSEEWRAGVSDGTDANRASSSGLTAMAGNENGVNIPKVMPFIP
jgi:hypothetical protein